MVYIASSGVQRGGNGSRSPVNGVTSGHNVEVRAGRDRVPRVGGTETAIQCLDRVGYPRVGRQIGV